MAKQFYTLGQILAVARKHPFYNASVQYPPSPEQVAGIIRAQDDGTCLHQCPIIDKKNMYVMMNDETSLYGISI